MSPGYRPHTVIFDFEKAEEQALQTALPFATIHGCFFQFKHYGGKFKNLVGEKQK
ncbi:unnamed protein product [Meloidogyne enterolobii]|uniref:Uncharacterized protein n=1 Tax=Meloidogyne enterolobii TaxID=390850 RepID=A0ACB0ZIS2_MELEN